MKLLVGLGNPGGKYARNRHNVGFMAVDRIREEHDFSPWKRKFQGMISEGEIGGRKVLLLKPETYMNESGRAVGEAARFLKITPADVIVIHDELDLAPGRIKVKTGGGNAGHNGLRSISAHFGNDYERVRIGIGHPGVKELVAAYALHDFAKADAVWLGPLLDAIAGSAGRLVGGQPDRFMADVAKAVAEASGEVASKPKEDAGPAKPRGTRSSAPHPAGERAAKRQGALAANLKRWLAGRRKES